MSRLRAASGLLGHDGVSIGSDLEVGFSGALVADAAFASEEVVPLR